MAVKKDHRVTSSSKQDIWLEQATVLHSNHCDERSGDMEPQNICLLVIHNISLPPAQSEQDFDNNNVERFFTGQLDAQEHPYFQQIEGLRVSAHLYIKRCGKLIQFVPLNKRAWHAGVSEFKGYSACNNFSIGIELQGTDDLLYTDAQYETLAQVTKQIQQIYPEIIKDNIVGHVDIAPDRKTDPGASFDWTRYKHSL